MITTTRKSTRINKFNGSFYESDQEDNLKDRDYNPNEFYEKLKESKSSTPSPPVELPKIDFTQYMNALSILSGMSHLALQEKIDRLTLKQKKQLFEYCTRPGSSSILLLEKCVKSVLMKVK
jgi:hypothetical protein